MAQKPCHYYLTLALREQGSRCLGVVRMGVVSGVDLGKKNGQDKVLCYTCA